jgi:hypothetical protein
MRGTTYILKTNMCKIRIKEELTINPKAKLRAVPCTPAVTLPLNSMAMTQLAIFTKNHSSISMYELLQLNPRM